MKSLIPLITVIFTVQAIPKIYTNKKALIEDLKMHCDSLCSTYDGVFEFNEKLKTCICYVGKYFDDTEKTLMRKNAKSVGMNLKTLKTVPTIVSKRETLEQEPDMIVTTKEEPKKKFFFAGKKPYSNKNQKDNNKFQLPPSKFGTKDSTEKNADLSDAVLGAAPINVNSRARPNQHNPLQPQNNPIQLLHPGATKDVWMKARQRLDRLIKQSDGDKFNSRFAASETQSIRNVLKPLTLRNKPSSGLKSKTSQNRNSGLMGNSKTGLGPNKHSPGIKITGNLKPSANANLNPFQSKNKASSFNPLAAGSKSRSGLRVKVKPGGQMKTRMSDNHRLVGSAAEAPASSSTSSTTSTTTDTNTAGEMVVVDKIAKIGSKVKTNYEKQNNRKLKFKGDLKSQDIVVQPTNTIDNDED